MAKAGFWLRGAKGKLAGAVAQKGQNGTILREIVTPKNPKTEKQIYQRAVMATVMKAYSAGKDIFDHSIQGLERGSKTQQYFIARNAKLLRSLIASELEQVQAGTLQPSAAVNCAVAPKSLYAVPNAYMISEGTYEQTFFTLSAENGEIQLSWPQLPGDLENMSVKDYASYYGLVPGDIYTLVAFVPTNVVVHNGVDASGNTGARGTKQFASRFLYLRMQVKSNVPTNTAAFDPSTAGCLSAIFEATADSSTIIDNEKIINSPLGEDFNSGTYVVENGSCGIIRSRFDEDLRSTSYMVQCHLDRAVYPGYGFGITTPYILPTWQKGADALGSSEKILESDTQGGFSRA